MSQRGKDDQDDQDDQKDQKESVATTNLPYRTASWQATGTATSPSDEYSHPRSGTAGSPDSDNNHPTAAGEHIKKQSIPPVTPKAASKPAHSTPVNVISGSKMSDRAPARRFPMSADLAYRSYTSTTLWDTFLNGIPDVASEHISNLRDMDEWTKFIDSCTGEENSNPFSSRSNEKEFRELIRCIVKLQGLEKHPGQTHDNPRLGRVRISHQGNRRMATWNSKAKWLSGDSGSTERQSELKPDLMSAVVEDAYDARYCEYKQGYVQFAKPETILPPPNSWKPKEIKDDPFLMVESTDPVWECLDLFWECRRNSDVLDDAKVYIDCALKAAEALRYQWSRRYIYCFLHCGTKMRLLHFDRSGLMASNTLDIKNDTSTFVRYLFGVFRHEPSRLGYPAGDNAPAHMPDPDYGDRLLQVVTVDDRKLYIDDQVTGPPRDHLVSRATMVFKAKLVEPNKSENKGWDYCYKSSWVQIGRGHEGEYLKTLQGLPNVVDMVVYGVVKVKINEDTTEFARQCSSGEPMTIMNNYYENERKNRKIIQHTGTEVDTQRDPADMLDNPRRPNGGSSQTCDNREHRDVVTAWVEWTFDDGISSSDLQTILSIWRDAFSAIESIRDKGILHRDMSFRNVRIDGQRTVKVCDFDMAVNIENECTGADERTGTVAFMATSMLSPERRLHRPVHDCESIFWLCALDLLNRIGVGQTKSEVTSIMDSGMPFSQVCASKKSIISDLVDCVKDGGWDECLYSFDNPKDEPLLQCLAFLAKVFSDNRYNKDYEERSVGRFKRQIKEKGTERGFEKETEKGFEIVCFKRCIGVIEREIDQVVQG